MKNKLEIANELYFTFKFIQDMRDSELGDYSAADEEAAHMAWNLAYAQLGANESNEHFAGLFAIECAAREKLCRIERIREYNAIGPESEPCELIPVWAAFDSEGAF